MSSYLPCSVGVPQGSILGPLLFMLFVNDLPFILDCGVEIYADDTTLTYSNKNSNDTSLTLTRNCDKISEWMEENTLKLNAGKTHLLTLGIDVMLDRPVNHLHVSMDGMCLPQSESNYETLLGCKIQSNLKWTKHISDLKRRLSNRIAGVYCIRKAIPLKTLKIICQGWFNSILVYCLPLYGGCAKGDLGDLQVIQNKLARLITFSPFDTSRNLLYDLLEWMTVKQLIFYHTALAVYKIRESGEPSEIATLFKRENRNLNVITPQSNMELYRNAFIYRAIQS